MNGRKKIEESKEINSEPKELSGHSTSKMFSKLLKRQDIRDKKGGYLLGHETELSDQVNNIVKRLISNDPDLQELDIQKWEVTILEKKAIFNALAINKTVVEANFSATNFSEIDAENFTNAFADKANKTLKILILNYNKLGDDGIEKIVKANLHLDKVVAMCCSITDVGAEKITQYATMPDICLDQNYITEIGVQIMLENKYFSELTYLALANNPIKDTTQLDKKIDSFSNNQIYGSSNPKLGE